MTHPIERLSPAQLKAALNSEREIAVLDVREEGVTARRRLLYATVAPVGRLGYLVPSLVPRTSTPIVLVDTAGEATPRAAAMLQSFGYTDVALLEGGVDAWGRAGFEVFTGTNVASKAFGEILEHALDTPNIDAATLRARQAAGENLVVLDSRPFNEFRNMNIPGGLDCPGAELVYRALAAAPDPATLIVVNCAGRTRSILGAQSLVNAGVPNPVAALTGGSMSWLLNEFTLEHAQIRTAPRPDASTAARARELALRVAERAGVQVIDAAGLARLVQEADVRTLYCFDVRDPQEFEAGHRPGFRHAPGGQLVQAVDEFVATLRARIVLADDDGVRARMTASWLQQHGSFEVYVLDEQDVPPQWEAGRDVRPLRRLGGRLAWLDADQVQAGLEAGTLQVIDVDHSLPFRRGHLPGARFVAASALLERLPELQRAGQAVVLASVDGTLAGVVAGELQAAGHAVGVLLGGTARWKSLGLPLERGDAGNLTGDDDAWYSPYHVPPESAVAAMHAYMSWQLQLPEQVRRDGPTPMQVVDFGTSTQARSQERLAALRGS
ncbi:MAG TPA: rhodanese-like domain-containing protein [Burkholderiaceae bacterium]|nr:rhodanese-like domain-containing protein [Burkholderiaceae bacterium]